jgi:5-methylthioadenosine/S-adenosylhomocysteine deaminase
MAFDLLIHNGTILTCNPDFDVIAGGWVGVRGETIAAIGRTEPAPLPAARELSDARGGIVMPGLINTHTHLPMTLFRGLADDLPLEAWLNEHIFPIERAVITPASVRWGALLACAEMALSGTTTCCDGYFHENTVAEALREAGLRAVLGQGVVDFPAPGVADPAENIRAAREFASAWLGRTGTITPSVFCHSPYTCSERTLVAAKRLCAELGLLFQVHAAETCREHELISAAHGVSPIGWLERIGVLDPQTLLVHCVQVEAADIDLIAERGAKVSHNPESNLKLGAGIAPVAAMLAAGITVGLGTDGCASNNDLDLFAAMDLAAKLHKVDGLDPTLISAERAIRMATIEGARALGLEREIGSIELGKQADLIVIDTRQPHLTPLHHPASAVVYAASGADVEAVWVAGRPLVRHRRLLTFDVAEVMRRVEAIAAGCRRMAAASA